MNWSHGNSNDVQIALSFVYDGTMLRAWEFICEMNSALEPILPNPTPENLELVLEQLLIPSLMPAEQLSKTDLYRRVYSTNVS